MAVIGDEDTVVGFLLGGVGELNKVIHVIKRMMLLVFSPYLSYNSHQNYVKMG